MILLEDMWKLDVAKIGLPCEDSGGLSVIVIQKSTKRYPLEDLQTRQSQKVVRSVYQRHIRLLAIPTRDCSHQEGHLESLGRRLGSVLRVVRELPFLLSDSCDKSKSKISFVCVCIIREMIKEGRCLASGVVLLAAAKKTKKTENKTFFLLFCSPSLWCRRCTGLASSFLTRQ